MMKGSGTSTNDNAQDIKEFGKAQTLDCRSTRPESCAKRGAWPEPAQRPWLRRFHQSLVLLFEKRVAMVGVRGKGVR